LLPVKLAHDIGGAPAATDTTADAAYEVARIVPAGEAAGVKLGATNAGAGDLTISKEVRGKYGDTEKAFTFTVYLLDINKDPLADEEFSYTGDVLAGSGATEPESGNQALDEDGALTFTLSHGQTITIADVPLDGNVRVVEADYGFYEPSFKDSDETDSETGYDTGVRGMTAGRTFAFTNVAPDIVHSGVDAGAGLLPVLCVAAIPTAAIALLLLRATRQRRKEARPPPSGAVP
jgi:hypothetical protein